MTIRTKIFTLFVFLIFLTGLYLPGNQPGADTLTVSGTIKDEQGNGIAGAEITASIYPAVTREDGEIKTRSGKDGRYTLAGIPENARTVMLEVKYPGFPSITKDIDTRADEAKQVKCDITLKKGGEISGTITAAGKPVKGVRLFCRSQDRQLAMEHAESSPEGHYLMHLTAGSHTLKVRHDDYKDEVLEISIKKGEKIVKNISLNPGKSITGTVVDKNGQPVADASISAASGTRYSRSFKRAKTGSKGRFEIKGLSEGKVTISVEHKNYAETKDTASVGDTGLKIVMNRGKVIAGRLIDITGSKPIEKFTLYAAPVDRPYSLFRPARLETSPGGKFIFKERIVSGKTYIMIATAPGYTYKILKNIDTAALDEKKGLEIKMSPGMTLKGRVLTKDGKPAAGAAIKEEMQKIEELSRFGTSRFSFLKSVKSDEAGEFILKNVPAEGIPLLISHRQFQDLDALGVPRGEQKVVTFRVASGYNISGRVYRSKETVAGLRVMAMLRKEDAPYRPKTARTDAEGHYSIKHLPPGSYSLLVYQGEDMMRAMVRSSKVEIKDQDVVLDFKPLGDRRIYGTVFLDGKTVKGAFITVATAAEKKEKPKRLCSVSSDDDGRYEVTDLPSAPLVLEANKYDMTGLSRVRMTASDKVDLTTVKEKQLKIKLKKEIRKTFKAGDPAPLFSAKKLDGKIFKLTDLRGKVVLLDFWATWCGPCIKEIPHIKKIYEKYKDKGFEIVAVSLDTEKKKLEDFIKKEKLSYLHLFDGKGWETGLTKAYGVWAVPTTFLVDKKGIIQAVNLRGEELEKEIQKLTK